MSYCIIPWWKILVFLLFLKKVNKIDSMNHQSSVRGFILWSLFTGLIYPRAAGRGHEARCYHCRVGLCQLVFLWSGKYFGKWSKMIHHSLNHDIVRVVAFVCPLVSIDKSQSQAQIVPKYFRVDSLLRFISKINMTVKGKKNVRWRKSMEITKCFQNPLAYNSLIFWLFLNQQKICADSKQPININVYGKGCQKVTYNHFP